MSPTVVPVDGTAKGISAGARDPSGGPGRPGHGRRGPGGADVPPGRRTREGDPGWLRLLPPGLRRDPVVRAVAALDPDPARTLLAVLTGTLALGSAVGLMATSAWLISRAAQHPPVLYLQVAVVGTRTFGLGRGVLRYAERLGSHDVALRGVSAVRERLYRRLAAADPVLVAGLRRGDLLARVGADVDALADLVVRSLLPFAVALATAAGAALLVGLLLPPAGLVVAAGLLVAALVAPWLAALSARRAEQLASQARTETSAEVLALLDGMAELTVAGALPGRRARLAALDADLAARLDRAARPAAAATGLATAVTGLAMIAALALGVQATSDGSLSPVLLAVITLTPLAAAEAVAALPAAAIGLVRARTAALRVLALLEAPAAGGGAADHRPSDDDRPAPRVDPLPEAVLTAARLSCGWPDAEPTLRGLDLVLRPGRRVAVVGASGCGKTTLLLTLAGLIPPVAGRVTLGSASRPGSGAPALAGRRGPGPIGSGGDALDQDSSDQDGSDQDGSDQDGSDQDGSDQAGPAGSDGRPEVTGTDLDQLDPAVVRRTVSFTAEDAHIFTTTVRENLRVACPDAEDDQLRAVLTRAGLGDWTSSLPAGLDTMLGSGGTGLSGGERRRLLLARALLVGAGILLLDEPVEHLDPATADALVRDVLSATEGSAGPAVVVVTHRLAPLDAADEVLLLQDGTVIARGTHSWLRKSNITYRDAWLAEQGLALPPRT